MLNFCFSFPAEVYAGADGKTKSLVFVDSRFGFEITYPAQLTLGPKKEGIFYYSSDKTFLAVRGIVNMEHHSWKTEYERRLQSLVRYKITYKTFRPKFFVISGYKENGHIFYFKEIPLVRDGKWIALQFNMNFPQEEKETWNPILVECANSLKPIQIQGKSPFTLGWYESVDELTKGNLLGLARTWINDHLQCVQCSSAVEEMGVVKMPLGKCTVDEPNDSYFNLTESSAIQFVLSVHGPIFLAAHHRGSDQKFVLFTFENGELSGKVIYQTSLKNNSNNTWDDSYTPFEGSLSLIDFTDGTKGLLLITNDVEESTKGHVFMAVHDEIKEVLEFEQSEEPIHTEINGVTGFNGVLEPQGERGLRLVKQNWKIVTRNEGMEKGDFQYSEIWYRFNLKQEKYLQVGKETKLPKGEDQNDF